MAKANRIIKAVDLGSDFVAFDVGNAGRIQLDVREMTEEIRLKAMLHGFNQKIRDAAAGKDEDDSFAAMSAVVEMLNGGDWTIRKGSTGPKGLKFLALAISQHSGKELELVEKALTKATDEQKASYLKNAKIAAIIAQMVADEAAAKAGASDDIDLGDLLEEDEEEEVE